jgi:class 3 adenylate cyclase
MSFLSAIPRQLRRWIGSHESKTVRPDAAVFATPPPASGDLPARYLESVPGSPVPQRRYPLFDQLEIGRYEDDRPATVGLLLVRDQAVSWRHCIITQTPEGRCFVRDLSRNGTRIDGRRLIPNRETEIGVGQTLDLGGGLQFVLGGESTPATGPTPTPRKRTDLAPQLSLATVLVGDIRDYTVMVRKADGAELQQSVNRVFEHLTAAVGELGGTIKEFPGDAILAFWEGTMRGEQAVAACYAAIVLDGIAKRIATDASIWTGDVSIDSFGGDTPIGLSMVGEPIVLASRLEKFATDETGSILVCRMTRQLVAKGARFAEDDPLGFRDLGPMHAKGFDYPDHVFSLLTPDS